MLWALTSAKGSPGVTTSALALAAAASAAWHDALLVEMDPAGGDLECWCGPHGEAGLLTAVTDMRGATADRLLRHAVDVVPGVRAVLAPTTAQSVTAALKTASGAFVEAVGQLDEEVVIVDLGRWTAGGAPHATALLSLASVVLVVCRSGLASVEHARALVDELREANRRVAVLMVGSTSPYPPDEVAAAVKAPVVGVLPWDSRGVGALVVQGLSRAWSRSRIAKAADDVVQGLARHGESRGREWASYG
jgi:MinD-like ATPase involved in chromosome partitioning or flagellar assembly